MCVLGGVYSGGALCTRDVEIWNEALIELPAEGNSIRKSSLKMIIKETSRAAVLKHGQNTQTEGKQLVPFYHKDITYTKYGAKSHTLNRVFQRHTHKQQVKLTVK